MDYLIRRDDGGEVYVQARCTSTAEAVAQTADNAEALEIMGRQASLEAVRLAEASQPPARRGGTVVIRVWFDPTDRGDLRSDFIYPDNE